MPTQFANTLNNHPIYADRAEKDAAGNTITTTYQEKLTAGTGITIDSSNVISATGGGGGGGSGMQVYHYTYTGSAMPLFTLNELTFSVNSSGYVQVQSSTVSTAHITILKIAHATETQGQPGYAVTRRNLTCTSLGDGVDRTDAHTPYAAPNISSGQNLMKLDPSSNASSAFPLSYECTIYYSVSSTYKVVKLNILAITNLSTASCELLISTMNG